MKGIKQNILDMSPYTVLQDFNGVKLNQNESACDLSAGIKKQVLQRLANASWNRYPPDDPAALVERISTYADFPISGILTGNSSNELIQVIIHACCDSGDQILTVDPTFSIYKQVADVMHINCLTVPMKVDFSFDVPGIHEKIEKSPGIKVVFLTSPNNPTGTVIDRNEIRELAGRFSGLLVVDEAYFEFYGRTAAGLIDACDNIVVLRTFSKALRGAGIRLGYLLAAPPVVAEIKKVRLPFSVGAFQQAAGEVILENSGFLQKSVGPLLRERGKVFAALDSMPGISPVPSLANFILFRSTMWPAAQIFNALYREGVLIRSYQKPGLKEMLRVSVGTEPENSFFLEKLANVLPGKAS